MPWQTAGSAELMGGRPARRFLTATAAGQPQGCKDSIWVSSPACPHSPPSSLPRDCPGLMAGWDKGGAELGATVAAPRAGKLFLFGSLTSRER
jgi:hypothetical protein